MGRVENASSSYRKMFYFRKKETSCGSKKNHFNDVSFLRFRSSGIATLISEMCNVL